MAGRDFTKTRWRAIRTAPCARERVTIMGKNSGVNPTARATAKSREERGGRPAVRVTANTKSTTSTTVRVTRRLKSRRPRWKADSGGGAANRATMPPKRVRRPVATTSAIPVPLITEEPRNTKCGASGPPVAGPVGSASFSTASGSPVRAACWTMRWCASSNRTSAGTRSPGTRRITSPGTSSRRGTSCHVPSRRTVAVGSMADRSRSTARWARYCWAKLTAVLARTMLVISRLSARSPRKAVRALETSSTRVSGSANRSRNCTAARRRIGGSGSLGP
jgi:hypothetical protein